MRSLARNQDFDRCNEIKHRKTELEEMVQAYMTNPSANEQLIERIDQNIAKLKAIQS